MLSGFSIGYLNFTIGLLLLTGCGLVFFVAKEGQEGEASSGKKERRAQRLLGWTNIALGLLTWICNSLFSRNFF